MYLVDRNKELTTKDIGNIIQQFQLKELPVLNKYYNYYKGNHEILKKQPSDIGKPCSRVVVNYCYDIVNNYLGYITGININYNSDNDFTDILEVLNYNDCHTEDSELLCDALTFGVAYEINYIDEDLKQRFKRLEPRECIPVYDNTLNQNLLYVIRFYSAVMADTKDEEFIVELYDSDSIRVYKANSTFSSFVLLEETKHYFNQVPITVFSLNREETSIFNQVIALQDAYNNLLSAEIDDFEAFADAYLVLKGVTADSEDLVEMKKNRVLLLDSDAEASYLTKSITDTQIQNMLENINDQIHKISKSPDFNDEKLMAQSGIAMRYKLIGFENVSSSIEARMKKALQKRIELICSVLNLTGAESTWRDVEIKFTRNLPANVVEITEVVNSLRGLVPDATLLSQIPFIDNPDEQMKILEEEKKQNMSLYNFGSEVIEDVE